MNTVAFYFSSPGAMDYPFSEKIYLETYIKIIEALFEFGIQVAVVRGDSYLGNGKFSHWFKWNGETFEKIDEPIEVDLIYNKDNENRIPDIYDCPMINHPDLDNLCRDKISTYKHFKEYVAKTWFPKDFEECKKMIDEVKGDKIVLKKNHEEGGEGVFVIDKSELKEDLYDEWEEIILQEFIDTSGGVPGIVEGLHDIRINVIDGQITFVYIRQPAKGSFLANYSQHAEKGTTFSVPLHQIPKEIKRIVKKIDIDFEDYYPRNYSLDFLKGPDRYYLTELNSRSTIYHPSQTKNSWIFNAAIVESFVNFFRKKNK